jgi:ASC-1-like (ASCH) protein
MSLYSQPFDMILSGKKTIELRLYDEKRRALRVGDTIEFTSADREGARFCCEIVALHPFPSFEKLYENLPLLQCGYTENDIDTAQPSDMERFYSAEEQKTHKVVGIELSL